MLPLKYKIAIITAGGLYYYFGDIDFITGLPEPQNGCSSQALNGDGNRLQPVKHAKEYISSMVNDANTNKKTNKKNDHRGREAQKPQQIPRAGWRDILLRVKEEQSKDNLSMIAAGVAFYLLFAIFPGIAAAVSIYGLVADPATIEKQVSALNQMMPQQAYDILMGQLKSLSQASGGALSLGLIGGIILALWSASKGMKALITAMNIAYGEEEGRGLIKFNLISLLLTLGTIVFGLIALSLIAIMPALFGNIGLNETVRNIVSLARWPILVIFIVVWLSLLYRYAPNRDYPRWQWVSWGSAFATLLWLVASILFSIYVSNFGSYNETYGSMGAIVILLMWLLITTYAVLLGAELNAEMEHQTRRDTTVGREKPMGERGAHSADTLGPKP
jgi:membrane protein